MIHYLINFVYHCESRSYRRRRRPKWGDEHDVRAPNAIYYCFPNEFITFYLISQDEKVRTITNAEWTFAFSGTSIDPSASIRAADHQKAITITCLADFIGSLIANGFQRKTSKRQRREMILCKEAINP